MAAIGKQNTLAVLRETSIGLYLDAGELGEVLLPMRYVPPEAGPGHMLHVFLYRDSEDRLIATTETPYGSVGEFATLKVVAVHPDVGAFLDWGLPKDLLLPFREQVGPVRPGQRVVVYIDLDQKTNRVVASARLNRFLRKDTPPFRKGEKVQVLIANRTPLGYNTIVENAYGGLLYHDTLPGPLEGGQRLEAFVREVRPDGKLDLSLEMLGYKKVASLTEQILDALERNGGRLAYDDESSPEAIRENFGVSKKAFKQALGNLYKHRRIEFEHPGIRLLDAVNYEPGVKARGDGPKEG
jgi:predicted RNA-binding protein (virulence factor B family)